MPLSNKHTYRDNAFVLRTQQLGDTDKIVILLTEQYGLIHAVAKSARKNKSKFGARLEPFMFLDVSFVYKDSLSLLSQAQTKSAYSMPLMSNYRSFLLGSLLNELVEKFARFDGEKDPYFFRLFHGAINALAGRKYTNVDITNAFMLRILKHTGWAFDINHVQSPDISYEQRALSQIYCQALESSQWVTIAEEDFGSLPLVIFFEIIHHLRAVLESDLLTFPLLQKELIGGS